MTGRKMCKRTGLDDETLSKVVALGLVPHRRRPRTGWVTYDADALLPCLIAAAYLRLGASSAADAAPLILALLAVPESERSAFANTVVLVKHIPASRIDWYTEDSTPLFPGATPQVFPLRKLIGVQK